MLFNKTNNKYAINIFNILCEVLIGFSVFAIFFGIFMTYFFTNYETTLLGNFISKSISFYKISIAPNTLEVISNIINNLGYKKQLHSTALQDEKVISNLINNLGYKQQLEASVLQDEKIVSEHNKPYDELLMKIILYMVLVLLFIIIVPLLLGIIRLEQISFKYIGTSILLHIILIVGFELLFLLFIITFINPVKLYLVFQNNKNKTDNYI